MEWAVVAMLLIWALKREPLQDVLAGVVGLAVVMSLCVGIFWASVIFPTFAIVLAVIAIVTVIPYILERLTLSPERIRRTIEKRRRNLGYDS